MAKSRRDNTSIVIAICLVAIFIVVAILVGYVVAMERAADERCAKLGAVAVESTGDRFVCVKEVR